MTVNPMGGAQMERRRWDGCAIAGGVIGAPARPAAVELPPNCHGRRAAEPYGGV